MPNADIGIIGLATMGQNLALNLANHGYSVAVFNRTSDRTRTFLADVVGSATIAGSYSVQDFISKLASPRRILLMVKAGSAVDSMIKELTSHLQAGDIVMDGGNSHFRDTERRQKELAASGIEYFGVGISGGEEGALNGPSIMPGGPRKAFAVIDPLLSSIAAQYDGEPCCAYVGPGGAGHFVKMAHNGCEYAIMQAIAEVYDMLTSALGMSPAEVADTFKHWNTVELRSYLVEITAKVLDRRDQGSNQPLVDVILDRAGQKGTGKWTSQSALDIGVSTPSIDAALWSRNISAFKEERVHAAKTLKGLPEKPTADRPGMIEAARRALYAAMVASYAQTFEFMRAASLEYGYGLDLGEIARIWRAGCIIRADLLDIIAESYGADGALTNLMLDPVFTNELGRLQGGWRLFVVTARMFGIPCPAISSALDYYDSFRRPRLPANLIQGMRDYFGAHSYERTDKPGTFHTDWAE